MAGCAEPTGRADEPPLAEPRRKTVIGDLDGLTRATKPLTDSAEPGRAIDTSWSGALLYGTLESAGSEIARGLLRARRSQALANIDTLSTKALVKFTADRVLSRVKSQVSARARWRKRH